jgi:DNA (cytosine-5)-methyltransferase 1
MRVGSLCTGYGGLEMGIEQAFGPIDLIFVSDIDKDVNTLLAHHHPKAPNLGDLTKVNWEKQQPVDLLCAGYPCQPFSVAGFKKGLEDERAIFGYIATGVSVLRPRYLFLENVSNHLALGGAGVIAEITRLGYDCRWGIVRAEDAGAPHKRARLFIWAQPANTNGEGLQRLWTEYELGAGEESQHTTWHDYEPSIRRWEHITGRPAPVPANPRGVEPAFVEWMMGLPEGHVTALGLSRTAQLKMLGNGVVPQQAALALHYLTEKRTQYAA